MTTADLTVQAQTTEALLKTHPLDPLCNFLARTEPLAEDEVQDLIALLNHPTLEIKTRDLSERERLSRFLMYVETIFKHLLLLGGESLSSISEITVKDDNVDRRVTTVNYLRAAVISLFCHYALPFDEAHDSDYAMLENIGDLFLEDQERFASEIMNNAAPYNRITNLLQLGAFGIHLETTLRWYFGYALPIMGIIPCSEMATPQEIDAITNPIASLKSWLALDPEEEEPES